MFNRDNSGNGVQGVYIKPNMVLSRVLRCSVEYDCHEGADVGMPRMREERREFSKGEEERYSIAKVRRVIISNGKGERGGEGGTSVIVRVNEGKNVVTEHRAIARGIVKVNEH